MNAVNDFLWNRVEGIGIEAWEFLIGRWIPVVGCE